MSEETSPEAASGPPAPVTPATPSSLAVPASIVLPAPSPRLQIEQQLQALEAETQRVREIPGTSGDTMLELQHRKNALTAQLAKLEGVDPKTGEPVSGPVDPDVLVTRLAVAGDPLTPEGEGFARAIATQLPGLHPVEGEQLLRDVWAQQGAAALERWDEDRAILATDPNDVALFGLAWDRMAPAQRAYLTKHHLNLYPPTVSRIARAMELWLGTPAGVDWLTKSGGWKVRLELEALAREDLDIVKTAYEAN